jgi:hypothetical protein
MFSRKLTGLFALCSSTLLLAAAAAPQAGRKSPAQRTAWTLSNGVLSATLPAGARDLSALEIASLADNIRLQLGDPFVLQLQDGQSLASSQMQLTKPLSLSRIAAHPGSARHAATLAGSQLCADFALPSDAGSAHWCLISREGTNYLRQELTLHAGATKLAIAKVILFRFRAPDAATVGTVAGSPIVDANFFLGFEDPLATNSVTGGNIECALHRTLPLEPGQTIAYSAVIGWSHPGQMRRDFLRYIEQERAHPYRTFLHYNSWYDIGYGERYDQAQALDRIRAFGEELVRKRHVVMDSFLFDDGWDNTSSLWKMDSGFPNGFTPVREAARKYGFGIGVWLSPWGGYSREKQERIAFGTKAGYEIVKGGYALSGPRYYSAFEQTCLEMIDKYGINQFKFDGTGNVNSVVPGSAFDSDFAAAIHLIGRLRQQRPDIYINLTTGTSPSPFWLRYADSIWRGGEDHSFAGVGTERQRWITYRDGQTYRGIVRKGPLFPLSSLMLHGILYAKQAHNLGTDPGNDFADEVHSYFGGGTQLQELYITPSLLTPANWDTLAEAARWSRANAATLLDTHWIGGDPLQLQVYGWASWSPAKGLLTLRNPSGQPQDFTIDLASAFELPSDAAKAYTLKSVWGGTPSPLTSKPLRAAEKQSIHLAPFEVLTFEALPANYS